MGRIVVMNQMTLDGVVQAPGRADEDASGGFMKGGWAQLSRTPGDLVAKAMSDRMDAGGGLAGWLFGRRTYEGLLSYWNQQPDSWFGAALNEAQKWVASRTLTEPLPWPNSTLLHGDATDAVRPLKAETTGVVGIMGSGRLVGSLMAAGLIDEYLLMIHPLILGSGRRLFPDGVEVRLRLIESRTIAGGMVIATYEPA